jgi:signal recognition particle receptor subunit beta
MSEFGQGAGQVNARIVYWGVEGAGKLTNLRVIHSKLRPDHRGDLRSVPTRLDPTVTYAVLPIELGQIGGFRTRIQVVAVPGAPEHAVTRKQLLDQVDGIVFVVDTSRERIDENLASFDELRGALAAYGRALEEVPLVIQYNKRDRSDPYALEELHRKLSLQGVAAFEAAAAQGTAVLQTLTTISKRVIRHLRGQADAQAEAAGGRAKPLADPELRVAEPPPLRNLDTAAGAPRGAQTAPASSFEPVRPSPAEEPEAAIAETAAAAQALFEPTFAGAAAVVGAEGLQPEGAAQLVVDWVGRATQTGPRAVRVPLVLRDGEGRRLALDLTLDLDLRPAEDDG